jgi:hypothetical protein
MTLYNTEMSTRSLHTEHKRVLKSKEKRNERKMAFVEYIGNFLRDGRGDTFLENATLEDSGRRMMMDVHYPVSEHDYIWYIRKDTDQEWVFQARSIENEFGKASDQFQRHFQAWAYPLSEAEAQYQGIKIASEKNNPQYFIRGGCYIHMGNGI